MIWFYTELLMAYKVDDIEFELLVTGSVLDRKVKPLGIATSVYVIL